MKMYSELQQPISRPPRSRIAVPGVLRRSPANANPVGGVPSIVQGALASPGQPLDAATRTFMEPRFGYDFSQVRVHADGQAAESSKAVNALAYTVGQDVVFGSGKYDPVSSAGRRLLAHELAHVVQQSGGLISAVQTNASPSAYDRHELAAETAAGRIADGQSAGLTGAGAAPGLQLAEDPAQPGVQPDTCEQFENDQESFSIEAAKHFLDEVDPSASREARSVTCEVSATNPERMECDVTFTDGQVIHVTWIKNLNNVEAQRPTPDGRQWCVYHYVCETPGTARYEKKGCSPNVKPRSSSPQGPDLVGSASGSPRGRNPGTG
jgi:hypothetical protein